MPIASKSICLSSKDFLARLNIVFPVVVIVQYVFAGETYPMQRRDKVCGAITPGAVLASFPTLEDREDLFEYFKSKFHVIYVCAEFFYKKKLQNVFKNDK